MAKTGCCALARIAGARISFGPGGFLPVAALLALRGVDSLWAKRESRVHPIIPHAQTHAARALIAGTLQPYSLGPLARAAQGAQRL